MIYKNFRINIVVRILLLIITIYAFLSLFGKKEFVVTDLLLAIAIVAQTVSLIRYIEKINRIVEGFLSSIKFSEYGQTINTEGLGSSFDNLKQAFTRVVEDFKKIRYEKEIHYFYLQNIISYIEIGIIAYKKDGTVEIANNAAKRMFNVNEIDHIKDIDKKNNNFSKKLLNIKHGENLLFKVSRNTEILQLSVYANEFRINDRDIVLVSFKNIQSELEEQELEAWQKLIRVLTHEIMNSIAPIASLTSTANIMVSELAEELEINENNHNKENVEDIISALETIYKRSNGLIHFVEQYRNLTKIPKPKFSTYSVLNQFNNIVKLFEKDLKDKNIKLNISVIPENLEITADEQLLEQVLINMIANSIYALENIDNKVITLKATVNKVGRQIIKVIDNGQGIIKEVGDKVFIPFFTTKSQGSGIGLSLAKQIMRLHSGSVKVQSKPNVETCFTLTF